jgi:hypothetical protein
VKFDELDLSEESQALAIHASGHMVNGSSGSYAVYFRPKYQVRKLMFDYSQTFTKNQNDFKLLLNDISIEDYETVFLCRGEGDFSDELIYKEYVGDFERFIFPDPDIKQDLVYGVNLPREINIHNEVSCTFIKALRDVESDLRSYVNNPLITLLKGKEKTVTIEKQHEIIQSIDSLNEQIGALEEIGKIREEIRKNLTETVGSTFAPAIDIRSELPNEIEKLFQSLRLWVGDNDDDYLGKLWELSLGSANIIYLSLKLLEYEKVRNDRIANFLLIEEPEAHIHTHIQKTLYSNLKNNGTQIILSTHSTHISSASKISSMNIIGKSNKRSYVFQPANKLKDDEISRVERYLDAVRSNLLFAKGVILVEGDSEQILIPELFKKTLGLSLDEIGISLINIGSTGFENVANLFHRERIHRRCAIITDSDTSVIPLPANPLDDNDSQKHCRMSQHAGIQRKKRLDEFCANNEYVKIFYSKFTFEVDLLIDCDRAAQISCIGEIYDKHSVIKRIIERLNNESIEISGSEILRVALAQGKGWFALLTAEKLSEKSNIPDYILKAIAFAASNINISTMRKSFKYRLNFLKRDDPEKFEIVRKKMINNMRDNFKQIVDEYIKIFPDDVFSKFNNLL